MPLGKLSSLEAQRNTENHVRWCCGCGNEIAFMSVHPLNCQFGETWALTRRRDPRLNEEGAFSPGRLGRSHNPPRPPCPVAQQPRGPERANVGSKVESGRAAGTKVGAPRGSGSCQGRVLTFIACTTASGFCPTEL